MLVLTRSVEQRIVIECPDGTLITVMPVRLMGDKVRIGFEAPRHVQIWREEIRPEAAEGQTLAEAVAADLDELVDATKRAF